MVVDFRIPFGFDVLICSWGCDRVAHQKDIGFWVRERPQAVLRTSLIREISSMKNCLIHNLLVLLCLYWKSVKNGSVTKDAFYPTILNPPTCHRPLHLRCNYQTRSVHTLRERHLLCTLSAYMICRLRHRQPLNNNRYNHPTSIQNTYYYKFQILHRTSHSGQKTLNNKKHRLDEVHNK